MKVTYKEYREKTPLGSFFNHSIHGYISSIFSPYVSIVCMKYNLKPNTITLMMFFTGIIGGFVLMMPNVWCKLFSSVVYLLWFTFDCSDGEVARFTQTFSKGGKYLDWCSHLTTHALFVVGMWLSIIQHYNSNIIVITLVSFFFLIAEMIDRNWISMDTLFGDVENNHETYQVSMSKLSFIYWQTIYMPNLIFLFPILISLDILIGLNMFYIFFILWAVFYIFVKLRFFSKFVCKLYNS